MIDNCSFLLLKNVRSKYAHNKDSYNLDLIIIISDGSKSYYLEKWNPKWVISVLMTERLFNIIFVKTERVLFSRLMWRNADSRNKRMVLIYFANKICISVILILCVIYYILRNKINPLSLQLGLGKSKNLNSSPCPVNEVLHSGFNHLIWSRVLTKRPLHFPQGTI